jgi:hypothetical protein
MGLEAHREAAVNPQQPPGYPPLPPSAYQPWQQGHAAPAQQHANRWLIPSLTAAGGLVLGGIIVGAATSGTTAGPAPTVTVTASPVATRPQGYHDPANLERDLRSILAKRLANPDGQYYDSGVTVKSLVCVETSKTAATCLWKLSDGTSGTDGVAISADGSRFITK